MPGHRRALLVATDEYVDERLPQLGAPARDAGALAEVLSDGSLGGFDVDVLHNATSWAICERHRVRCLGVGLRGGRFARSPRRQVKAGELPQELGELVSSPSVGVRLGAVHDLGVVAAGDVLPRAMAAMATLRELEKDDSKKVSGAAAETLTQFQIRLSRDTVDLGLVAGQSATASGPAASEVKLTGVPLALASSVTADPGLRAWIDGDRLMVTAAPSAAGPIEGTVTVTGPAGQASVNVSGWATPDPGSLIQDALRLAGAIVGDPAGEALVLAVSAWVAEQIGDHDQAVRLLARTPELVRAMANPWHRAVAGVARAWLLAQAGDRQGASAELSRVQVPTADATETGWLCKLVELLIDWVGALLGDRARATRILPAVAELIRDIPDARTRAFSMVGVAWVGSCTSAAGLSGSLLDEAAGVLPAEDTSRGYLLLMAAWVWGQLGVHARAWQLLTAAEQAAAALQDVENRVILSALVGWLAVRAGDPGRGARMLADLVAAADGIEDEDDRLIPLFAVVWVGTRAGAWDQVEAALAAAPAVGGRRGRRR